MKVNSANTKTATKYIKTEQKCAHKIKTKRKLTKTLMKLTKTKLID